MVRLISFTGPSGTGKTSLVDLLLKSGENCVLVKSTTTRTRRATDLPNEYDYVSEEDFGVMVNNGEFLWSTTHAGVSYGTRKESIVEIFRGGSNSIGCMILVPKVLPRLISFLEENGWLEEFLPLYILPPSEEELLRRLIGRGDQQETIEKRFEAERGQVKDVKESSVPYRFIQNQKSPEDLFVEFKKILR